MKKNLMEINEKYWISGPCAVESEDQIFKTARLIVEEAESRKINLYALRAGAWKIRSNPNGFQGAGDVSLSWLNAIQKLYNVPVCVEVVNAEQIEKCAKNDIKIVWIGARTAVNPVEVQQIADAVRKSDFTVMVKNPIIPDLKLWLGNIERFLNADVKVMAIHRGFSNTNENVFRNSPMWQIPIELKVKMPDLPVLCDPSHICGKTILIPQISQIAMDYGFNGLMLECHHDPQNALSDADQQLTPMQWGNLLADLSLRSNIENLDIEKFRSQLENIDIQLSELLYKRMKIVDDIAEIKRKNNIAVVQPRQWENVVKRYQNHTDDADYQEFMDEFLKLLHQYSIKRQ